MYFSIFTKYCWKMLKILEDHSEPAVKQHLKLNTSSSFALQYENQAQVFGKWGTTGLVGRYKFSDVTGKLKLKQEYFMPPRGWEWEGDWFIDPEKA